MKTLLSLTVLVFSFNLLASTHEIVVGSVYQGEEEIKERPTGRSCQVKILSLTPASRGRHCFEVTMQVMHETLNLAVPLKVVSRITNYHRPEYPQIKTCAKTLDSRTDSDEIIRLETSNLVTDTFGGTHKNGRVQYDYFLSLDRLDKTPTRSRIHVMKLFSEVDYDCVRLEKI